MIGEIKYLEQKTMNGKITSEDRAIIGDTNPVLYLRAERLIYDRKNLTLGLFFQGTHGNDYF